MKFKVGDLAITQNSKAPALNDRLLVVVVTALPGYQTPVGAADYQIRRLDGQPFGWTTSFDGIERFFKQTLCWCKELNLKPPEEAGLKEEFEVQRHPMQGAVDAYEEQIRRWGEEMVAQERAMRVASRCESIDISSTDSKFRPNDRQD